MTNTSPTNFTATAPMCSAAMPFFVSDVPMSINTTTCKAALEKITNSVTFSRAGQLRRMLSWLGERSIDHPERPPREKEIAAAVLGRPDFDPQTDSLVRKEMSRLRDKLTRYYEREGANDEVMVRANSGYVLSFEKNDKSPATSRRLCCLILPFRSERTANPTACELLEDLIFELGERGGYEVISRTTAMAYLDRSGDARQFAAECGANVIVEGTLHLRGDLIEVTTWLVDGKAGHVVRSKKCRDVDCRRIAESIVDWLAEAREPGEASVAGVNE